MPRIHLLLTALTLSALTQITTLAATEPIPIAIGDVVTDGFVNTTATPGAGNIGLAGEVDVYTFSGAAGQRVYFNGLAPGGSGFFFWSVSRPDKSWLFDVWLYVNGGPGTYTLPDTGTYTLYVRGSSTATGAYSFRLNGLRPPVAGDDVAATTVDRVVDLPVARLLANDLDLDRDALALSLPMVATTQGGMVAINGASVRYTPPPHFNGTDTFTYQADDGWGHSDTATVTVTVRKAETLGLNTISATRNPDGSIALQMAGIPVRSYQIWFAPDIAAGPWTLLDTAAANAHGVVSYTDISAIGVPIRFYRLAEMP